MQGTARKKKFARIIVAYPFALIILSVGANLLLGVTAAEIAIPPFAVMVAMSISACLLLANHSWLMTSTELVRLRYDLHATPEEWEASGTVRSDASEEGLRELERRHNAHNNATENTVYFALLALPFCLISPDFWAAVVWPCGFALGRLGHTFSYLSGRDSLRGICMSISLTALYGLAGYTAIAIALAGF